MSLILKVLRSLVLAFLFLFIAGIVFEQVSRWQLEALKPDATTFVSIGDRSLHFHKQGAGNKTVIFESGIGGDHVHWTDIQAELSNSYTTLSYDRAGILWSDSTAEISLERYEKDLSMLLELTDCPKPYILVGHSFAGITLRSFIRDHAKDIAGIVFVDVTHPQLLEALSPELQQVASSPPSELIKFLDGVGILRLMYSFTPFTRVVPKDHFFNVHAARYFYKILPGLLQEVEHEDALMLEAAKIRDFGDIPLVVITAEYPEGVERIDDPNLTREYLKIHHRLQQELLDLSTRSSQLMAEKSGHYVTLQEPELIWETVEKIAATDTVQIREGN
ncbi:MAG: alpha/beta hydrolase [Bacteroidota bacterium]